MDDAIVAVAERLGTDFPQLSVPAVLKVVTDCAGDFPNDDAQFVEQAAKARLSSMAARAKSRTPRG